MIAICECGKGSLHAEYMHNPQVSDLTGYMKTILTAPSSIPFSSSHNLFFLSILQNFYDIYTRAPWLAIGAFSLSTRYIPFARTSLRHLPPRRLHARIPGSELRGIKEANANTKDHPFDTLVHGHAIRRNIRRLTRRPLRQISPRSWPKSGNKIYRWTKRQSASKASLMSHIHSRPGPYSAVRIQRHESARCWVQRDIIARRLVGLVLPSTKRARL